MRSRAGLAAVFLALLLAGPVAAQQQGVLFQSQKASSMLTGVDPTTRALVPLDLTAATRSFQNNSKFVRTPTMPSTPFSLTSILPKMQMPSWPVRIGSSNVPKSPIARRKTSN